jgi:hypothetical protein
MIHMKKRMQLEKKHKKNISLIISIICSLILTFLFLFRFELTSNPKIFIAMLVIGYIAGYTFSYSQNEYVE